MLSNPVSIINPYYITLGISNRLKTDTKFLRGDGFVLEQGYVDSASKKPKDSYVAYSSESVYLNDNKAFIEKPTGKSKYVCTLKYEGTNFSIREFAEDGIMYCDDKPDLTYPFKITVSTNDHGVNYVMLKKNDLFLGNMRYLFERGCFRFKDMRCKEAVLNALSY